MLGEVGISEGKGVETTSEDGGLGEVEEQL
jgi:hypothetical protein